MFILFVIRIKVFSGDGYLIYSFIEVLFEIIKIDNSDGVDEK